MLSQELKGREEDLMKVLMLCLKKDEDDDGLTAAADVSVLEQTLCLLVNLSNVDKIKDNLSKDDSFIATLLLILVSIYCLSYFVCAYSRTRVSSD